MLTNAERIAAMAQRVKDVVANAEAMFGVTISPLKVSYDVKGRVAGWAGCKHCRIQQRRVYSLRFNTEAILSDNYDDMLNDTVPHEVAHLVCYANPMLGSKHNEGWRRVCVALGGTGKRTHSYQLTRARPKAPGIIYRTNRGHEVEVTALIHNKIQQHYRTYTYRDGKGSINRSCEWAPAGQALPPKQPAVNPSTGWATPERIAAVLSTIGVQRKDGTVAVPPAPKPAVQHTGPGSMPPPGVPVGAPKSEYIRGWISLAKRNGMGMDSVISTAQAELGMTRALASTYVKNNWPKVW